MSGIHTETDLIFIPEFFSTGFSVKNVSLAEPMHGPTAIWMQKIAREMNGFRPAQFLIIDQGHCFNRALYVSAEGIIGIYDKRHLFSLGSEHNLYTPGNKNVIIE